MTMLPYRRRYRTGTAELAPFWRALALYRHALYDDLFQLAEWGGLGLDQPTLRALQKAGFSCYRAIPPCPDWLLASVPELGATRLAELRRILPYSREIYKGPLCPGRVLENAQSLERTKIPGIDAYVAEQARREMAGEPELIGTDAVLAAFRP